MVFAGDEQLPGQALDFRALADGVSPQAVVLAQLNFCVDFENRSWLRRHVGPYESATKPRVGFNKVPRKHLRKEPTEEVIEMPTLAHEAQAHALLARGVVQIGGVCDLADLGLGDICKWEESLVEAGLGDGRKIIRLVFR